VLLTYGATLVAAAAVGRVLVRQSRDGSSRSATRTRSAIIVGAGRREGSLHAHDPGAGMGFRVADSSNEMVTIRGRSSRSGKPDCRYSGGLDDLRDISSIAHGAVEVMIAEPTAFPPDGARRGRPVRRAQGEFQRVVPDIYDVVFGRGSPGPYLRHAAVPLFPCDARLAAADRSGSWTSSIGDGYHRSD